jgi:hypothetical protein
MLQGLGSRLEKMGSRTLTGSTGTQTIRGTACMLYQPQKLMG